MRTARVLAILLVVQVVAAKALEQPSITLSPAQAAALGAHIVQPDYPFEARRRGISGRGVFFIEAEIATGAVQRVYMERSTGSTILDNSVFRALKQWRFKPAMLRSLQRKYWPNDTDKHAAIRVPITFTLRKA